MRFLHPIRQRRADPSERKPFCSHRGDVKLDNFLAWHLKLSYARFLPSCEVVLNRMILRSHCAEPGSAGESVVPFAAAAEQKLVI